ncbi:hypothetical protein N7476_010833 [Penicillium atrosanguineum]|uniref:Xylanolytic transcriptional activator regulatory domain-containing protein n=2 Tax=Penicillium atrosanguineum TaxID=1132637 RepID=A0A9W9PLH5_9EURO|nr:hypothetical protein N7476_010833 [Penicillium atrosanguineum]
MPDYIQNAEDALSKPIANMELADKTFLESHVTAFFEYFNSIPQYNFIHKPTFLRSFHHNNLDPLFLRCVCGIASRFVQPNTEDYTSDWLREVEAQIWPRISEMKVQNLQILLLLICWYSLSRKISSMWTASAMAARMAYGIRLNHEADGKMPFVSKEVRRRLMWSIFMLDRLYAGGFPELTLCATETIHINLPCEERNFDLDIPLSTPVLKPTITTPELESGIGIMGYITRLIDIRHAILECTKLIIASKTNPYTARESIRGLDSRLRIFSESLPAHLKESHRNLLCRAYTSDLTGYINLHTLWRQCHCDLYRMMIPGIRESVTEDIQRQVPIDYAENCRRLCLHHALAMCKLWSDTLSEAHVFWLSDQSIGIYAYQCANILVNLWDLDCDAGLKAELTIISSFLDRLAVLYPVVAEIQSEINGFITSLDVVTDFYQAHSDGMLSQTLTAAWRSTLRQQGIQEGQTASKFSLLEFLHNQNKVEDANADEDYSVPNIDAPPEPSTLNGTDMGLGISATSDKPYLLDELWSSAQLEMDFDSYGTRVDPFCRIFDDWSLAVE